MAHASNLRFKRGIYHFRRKVPHSLTGRFGCREIIRSLRTANPLLAAHRARVLWLRCDVLFDAVKTVPTLTREQIEAIVRRWLD